MMRFGNDAINHTAEGMKVPDSSDFCQNFTFYLADNKFITGHIEHHDDGFYGAGCSVINDVENPLSKTFIRTTISESGTNAKVAFKEVVTQVIKDTNTAGLSLSMVASFCEKTPERE